MNDSNSRLSDLFIGLIGALVVFVGVPAVLLKLVGNPIHPFIHLHRAESAFIALSLVAWAAWLWCCLPIIRGVIQRVQTGDLDAGAEARLTDRLAVRIAAGALVIGAMVSSAPLAGATAPIAPSAVTLVSPPALTTEPLASAPLSATSVTVAPGQSLWTIALDHLGAGSDWPEIAAVNMGRPMPGGERFVDPALIKPGWILVLPGPDGAPILPTAPSLAPSSGPTSAPVIGRSEHFAPASTLAPLATSTVPTPSGHDHANSAPAPSRLPEEMVALGLGTLGIVALRRRVRADRTRRLAVGVASANDDTVDVEIALEHFGDAVALDWLHRANQELVSSGANPEAVRLVRVHSGGVDVLIDHLGLAPAPPWEIHSGGWWRYPVGAPGSVLPGVAVALPLLVPVGDNRDGAYFVALSPGSCLPVIGSGAQGLIESMVTNLLAWPWAAQIQILDSSSNHDAGVGVGVGIGTVWFGDPRSLDPGRRSATAVVTSAPVPASDLTVTTDERGTSLHPLGVTLRALATDARTAGALRALADDPGPSPTQPPARQPVAEPSAIDPGPVEIRLLSARPHLEGNVGELDPKRSRRIVEVLAYLALHHPDPVTTDRLRSRVLGTSENDAAAKTLFNTVTAARRALGSDSHGAPLLPAATKSGLYAINPVLTCDVRRFAALVAASRSAADATTSMAYLRSALELIEGEPFSATLTGYGWWQAEGHGARLAALVVDAASELAGLCQQAGAWTLGQWGLEQARLVEPYSESLTRAAMTLAAAMGDVDRLRREWSECQRRVDELDPGALPSSRTEQLYYDLATPDTAARV